MAKNVFTDTDSDDGLAPNTIAPLSPKKMSSPYSGIGKGIAGLKVGSRPKNLFSTSMQPPKMDTFEKQFGASKIKAKNSFGKTTGKSGF